MSIDRYDPHQARASLFFGGVFAQPGPRSPLSRPTEAGSSFRVTRRARGSASTALLIAVCFALAAAVVVGFLWWGALGTTSDDWPGPAPGGSGSPTSEPHASAGGPGLTPVSEGGIQVGVPMEWKEHDKTFGGTCTISGMIEVDPGVEFPASWRLVIQPSRLSIGREHAEERVLDFDGNERTFEEFDLPMGGYRVHVEAPGMSCRGQEVMLFKLKGFEHLPGKNHAHLLLKLIPAGSAEGIVRDSDGVGVANLPVFVENQQDRGRQTTLTDSSGYWRIDELIEGPYLLSLGNIDRPLIAPAPFGMVGDRYSHPDQVIPLTHGIQILVVDEQGLPVADAQLRGYGRPAGVIEATSEVDGTAQVSFLPSGEYTLRGEARGGLAGVTVFRVTAQSPDEPVTLQLTRDG